MSGIIPVRCFSCGMTIDSKYNMYTKLIDEKYKNKDNMNIIISDYNIKNKDLEDNISIFNKIGISRICCKRMLTTHPDDLKNHI
tara:strand:+ start:1271 stop:1522 length:252 start_codon:yes stop_codon:yes gene_type:complete